MAEITVAQIGKLRQQTGAGLMDCKKALTETEGDVEAAIEWLRKKGAATAEKKSTRTTSEGVIALNLTGDGKKGTLVEINCETDFVAKNDKFQEFCNEIAAAYSENPEPDLEEKRTTTVAEIGENIQLTRNESLSLDGPGAVATYIHHGAKVGVLAAVETGKDETTQTEPFKQLLNDITLQITAASPEALDRDALDQDKLEKEREIAREQFKDKPAQAIEKIVEGKIEKYYSEVCLVDQDFVKGEGSVKDHVAAVAKELGDEITIKAFIRFQVGETQED
jgi:elongation factor Ts|tara:strand:+ start:301 stop:1137 length:837 start_codon:yes stop_codon:yes gene_type:complete